MALTFSSKSKTYHYSGRVTPLVILSCMVAATGGILFGYDLGISGGVTSMETFLEKFFPKMHAKMREDSHTSNYCKFDSQLLTAFTSSLYIAGAFASLCASPITHRFGRRTSILLGGALFLAGAIIGGLAINIYMLLIGRVLLGIGIGFTNQSVPLYLSELAPPHYRGLLNNAFEFFVGLGVLFANLINYGTQSLQVCLKLSSSSQSLPTQTMALRFSSKSKTYHYSGRVTPLVILSCMVAATGGILFGYDLGISGGLTSMETFLEKFFPKVHAKTREDSHTSNYCKFDSQLLTAFTSSLYIAGAFASLCASSVTHRFGRRTSIILGGASFLAGAIIGGLAINICMLLIGRILLGIGIGFTNQSVPLYLSELAPPHYRGLLNNAFEFFVGLGVLFANLINYGTQKMHSDWSWRTSLFLALAPAAFLTLGTLFLPETPISLLQRNKTVQEATEILKKIRGTADVQDELNDMIAAANFSKTVHHPFYTIMQRKYRPQLVMAIAITFFKQATGINVITFYAPVIFRIIGLGESSSLMSTVIIGVAGTGAVIMSMIIVDKFGRRVLLIIGGVQMLVAHVMVGALMLTRLGDHGGMSRAYAYTVLVLTCAFVAGFTLSWGPLGWLIPSEIFPLEIRSVGQSIVVTVGFLLSFVLAQSLLAMLCHLKSGVFFFFGGWVLVMTIFVYLLLPETKNQPIEQMDRVWREHWFWKKVVLEVNL